MKKVLSILLMLLCVSLGANAARCKGLTQKGTHCKNKAKYEGYCKIHYDKTHLTREMIHGKKRCQAATRKGTQCKNNVLDGSDFCHVHKDKHVIFDGSNKPVENPNKPDVAENSFEQCQGITKKGTRCKLKVVDGSKFCNIHKNR